MKAEQNRKPNRLIREKSPYLLQHAYNPVDWYPWGEEAFARARAEDKPVFLSIGYSTCHWCHVMARESFSDYQTATVLNQHYIAVKVDREERPDIDAIYMEACQALTGQGGWPLSVFLTPDKKPFFAGTYFPPVGRYGRPGFRDLLITLHNRYRQDPDKISALGNQLVEALKPRAQPGEVGEEEVHRCYQQLAQAFDSRHGGFGGAPKFPTPHHLMFLLRYHRWTGKKRALDMVCATLDAMAAGGIYDHIGYGFARYATDARWLVPHFEKMLYDNALLCMAYTEAWQVTGAVRYATIAREILEYVARDMTDSGGAFYSAEDAETEGEEGKFYLWRKDEVIDILGKADGEIYCRSYGITAAGNFNGRNIPNLIDSDLAQQANYHNMTLEQLKQVLEQCRSRLFVAREKRVRPHRDDKILTAWNALMISALAMAGRALGEDSYVDRAARAWDFIWSNLREQGRLLARWRQGEAKYLAYIDDYAFMLWAALELYAATVDPSYLRAAVELARVMVSLFWDDDQGGFYFYGHDAEELVVRPKEIYDGAMPSGNSVAARELLRLARLTGQTKFEDMGNQILSCFAGSVRAYPAGYSHLIQAALAALVPGREVVIAGDLAVPATRRFLRRLQQSFAPEVVWLAVSERAQVADIAPFAAELAKQKGRFYICRNNSCTMPVVDPDQAWQRLQV